MAVRVGHSQDLDDGRRGRSNLPCRTWHPCAAGSCESHVAVCSMYACSKSAGLVKQRHRISIHHPVIASESHVAICSLYAHSQSSGLVKQRHCALDWRSSPPQHSSSLMSNSTAFDNSNNADPLLSGATGHPHCGLAKPASQYTCAFPAYGLALQQLEWNDTLMLTSRLSTRLLYQPACSVKTQLKLARQSACLSSVVYHSACCTSPNSCWQSSAEQLNLGHSNNL